MLRNGEKTVLLALREHKEHDLGRKGRQGPDPTAPGSHSPMDVEAANINETNLEREPVRWVQYVSSHLKHTALKEWMHLSAIR